MKLVFIIGNSAVGKMTVGQELMKITDLRLFHNHMSIEQVIEIFGYLHKNASNRIRDVVFEEFAASGGYGMIFTFMWAFDQQEDWDYIEHVMSIFRPYNTEFYFVELVASVETRLHRNRTENRLRNKASKRDIALSEHRVKAYDEQYRLESMDGELPFDHYLKIDNTDIPAAAAAEQIKAQFDL